MDNDLRWKLIIAGVVGGACALFTAGLVLGILVCRKILKQRRLAKERLARQLQITSSVRRGNRRTSSPMLDSVLDTPAVRRAYPQPASGNLLEYTDIPIRSRQFRRMSNDRGGHEEPFLQKNPSAFLQTEVPRKDSTFVGTIQSSEQSTTSGSSEFTESSILHPEPTRYRNQLAFPQGFDDHHNNTNVLLHSEFSLHSGDRHRKANGFIPSKHSTHYMPPEIQTKIHCGWPVNRPKFEVANDNWSNSIDEISAETERLKHIYRQHNVEPVFGVLADSGQGSWTDVEAVHDTCQSHENQGLVELDHRRDWLRKPVRQDYSCFQRDKTKNFDTNENHSNNDWIPTTVEEVWLPRVDLEERGSRENFRYTPRRVKT